MAVVDELPEIRLLAGLEEAVLRRIRHAARERNFEQNAIIVSQHDEARHAFFLLTGIVQFLVRIEGMEDLLVGTCSERGALLGWSTFRPPYRYTTTVRCETPCRVLELERRVFDELFEAEPQAGYTILTRVALDIADRMEQARDQLTVASAEQAMAGYPRAESSTTSNVGPVSSEQAGALNAEELLAHSAFFEAMAPAHRQYLTVNGYWRQVSAGELVLEERACADDLYVVGEGSYRLTAELKDTLTAAKNERSEASAVPIRIVDEPGETLGWSAVVPPHRYRASATAITDGRLFVLKRDLLESYARHNGAFGIALMRRILWVLGNRLRTVRTRLIASRYDQEIVAIRALIDQTMELLQVTSPLLKIPHYLEHRLTIADAFQCLDLVKAHGTETERRVAGLCLEVLDNVRQELDFYKGLQTVYEHIANAPANAAPSLLRLRCSREFMAMFERLDYVIVGEENLPPSSGHLFIMNHLCAHPDTTLPNNFKIILDTHFVSSMILHRKYGEPPIRVVRGAFASEIGQKAYYERLGYIIVPPRDPNATTEAKTKPGEALREFLDRAEDELAEGRNIVICPEGTCTTTERSPTPFKIGAFALAADARPEPLIVPIAMANFDRKVTRTRLVAVVCEPFRISEKIPGTVNRKRLHEFAQNYRETFREYVQRARELGGTAS